MILKKAGCRFFCSQFLPSVLHLSSKLSINSSSARISVWYLWIASRSLSGPLFLFFQPKYRSNLHWQLQHVLILHKGLDHHPFIQTVQYSVKDKLLIPLFHFTPGCLHSQKSLEKCRWQLCMCVLAILFIVVHTTTPWTQLQVLYMSETTTTTTFCKGYTEHTTTAGWGSQEKSWFDFYSFLESSWLGGKWKVLVLGYM